MNKLIITIMMAMAAWCGYALDIEIGGGGIVYTNTAVMSNLYVSATGQTNSYAARDDGALQLGVDAPDPLFTVLANTNLVQDNRSGLVWARDANLFGTVNWGTAITNCNSLTNGGYSDWRLPNMNEIRSLFDYKRIGPVVSDATGTNAWSNGNAFLNVQGAVYWTSTTTAWNSSWAWKMSFYYGEIGAEDKAAIHYVWPVRGGHD